MTDYPALVITGARRVGKTSLLRHIYPNAEYVLLEDPDIQARARSDPRALIESLKRPVIFDEIQYVPEILPYVRSLIDYNPRSYGDWMFTGSQEAPLMKGVTESMSGRAAVVEMMPLSLAETDRVNMLSGGFPDVALRPMLRHLWFGSYIQTYLERDVRTVLNIRDMGTFRRFMALVASRHGQILNRADLAVPLGISIPTITEWLYVLELTGQVLLVQPYFENFGKRLIKSPKVYWSDPGFACYLLGITTQKELDRSPFLGAIFEGFVASEIAKSQINHGLRREIYFFRDQQGLEVDFLFTNASGELCMVECKATKTVMPAMAAPMLSLRKSIPGRSTVNMYVVHRTSKTGPATTAIAPEVQAVNETAFSKLVNEVSQRLVPAPKRRRK